ncbi:MAG: AAA family ATPase, partial [Bullifex sp.]
MRYLSVQEYAKKNRITPRRVQQMCKEGSIKGAFKQGRSWGIPIEDKKKLPLPVGVSDYKKASDYYFYVDKTLMIKDILDERPEVSLYTRPRRFGKSLNMDMLRTFFEISDEDNSVYFRDRKIWECGENYTNHQGQYPVIYLSFKDSKCLTWEETRKRITRVISLEFMRHRELEESDKLDKYERNIYGRIASGLSEEAEYEMSLQYLSIFLNKHYERKCVIIIDEYDTPIIQGYSHGFYNEATNFMRNFFSNGLKDNNHMVFGFLTGILRVAKESIFSGLNNLKVYSILNSKYSAYFGFVREEVEEMLSYYEIENKKEEIREWYDGYRFGDTEVYNPWSVINYISDGAVPNPYWLSTGGNEIIGETLSKATLDVTKGLEILLNGGKITTIVDTDVIYPEIGRKPYIIYSFLLLSGYLKIEKIYPQLDGNYMCDVKIPNKEISYVYEKEIINRTGRNDTAISIKEALFSCDERKLQSVLESFMLESISSFDGANEGFYHGMMLGLCAMLNGFYHIKSNRESGLGRFDILLSPKENDKPGFIFEFKYTRDEKEDLKKLATKALEQIIVNKYDTELKECGVSSIIRIG